MDAFLNQASLAIIVLAMVGALIGMREAAAWLHRRSMRDKFMIAEPGYVLSGVLTLLGLLIGFTFSLALDRYEVRSRLLVAEASALSTVDMRVQLLDQAEAERLGRLVREYSQVRLQYGNASTLDKPSYAVQSRQLRHQIRTETLLAVRHVRDRPFAPLVIQSVNDLLAIGAEREAAHGKPLPGAIMAVLMTYALVAAAVLGYTLSEHRHQHRVISTLLFLLLALALALILDLDRARSGAIRIDQAPMQRLVETLAAEDIAGPAKADSKRSSAEVRGAASR